MRNFFAAVALCCLCLPCSQTIANSSDRFDPAGASDFTVRALISDDGSGKVDYQAFAVGASCYEFDLGNGDCITSTSGILSYRYNFCATATFTVIVKALLSSGVTLEKSLPVRFMLPAPFTNLVWSDEFNVDGAPDSTKWGYQTGTGNNGWGNAEMEYYTNRPDNVVVKDGCLIITAKKENYQGSAYTSARVLSKHKFTYCKVDIRAKLPAAAGTWPALWMLGNDIGKVGWPACGEIDIAEQRASELNKIYATLHYPGLSSSGLGGATTLSEPSSGFHKYTLEWTAATITISVDDRPIFTTDNKADLPFHHDFFFILNVAMGGGFGGNIAPSFNSDSMVLDYIRVYQ